MRISYRHRFIFIHIDRTGGTSISEALDRFSYQRSDWSRLVAALLRRIGCSPSYYRWKKLGTQHVTAQELRDHLPTVVFDSFFKFAFVRNPWDWLVSLFHARLQHPVHPEYELAKYLGDFGPYVRWWVENKRFQQRDYVTDGEGKLLVDFVGTFESLSSDFQHVCGRIGIEASLPHRNSAVHRKKRDFREYYDDDLRELVAQACQDDIRMFGYSFDD